MNVPLWVWAATVAGLAGLIVIDLAISARKGPHVVGMAEAGRWAIFYVAIAVVFGIGLGVLTDSRYAGEFFAGFITEKSLSVDNLFIFVVIMTSFAVPAIYQHKVLMFGIVLALVMRGLFIAAGAAAVERFVFTFFVFGAFLIFTAVKLAKNHSDHAAPTDAPVERSRMVRLVEKVIPTTDAYDGAKVTTRIDGKRYATPMLMVMIAIGSTDLLFALDSIPAIFGLTQEAYIVFTANAFALMGLRQLYFLLDGLLDRLIYLSKGLAVILAFIGVKLVLHAAHGYSWGHWVPEISTSFSLSVILGVLAVTTVASLLAVKRNPDLITIKPVAAPAPEHAVT